MECFFSGFIFNRDLKNERENIVGRGSNMCEGSEAVGQDGWGQLCKALNAIIKR